MSNRPPTQRVSRRRLPKRFARAQLSLVEHALCPLDSSVSLQPNSIFDTDYFFTDTNRNRKKAHVRIGGLDGLSAHDEFYLWGILALALSQPKPTADFTATPYHCLRQLGVITTARKGGREFELFRAALKRLAGVRYQNDRFYDSVRGEHREVSFGFLNYSLPIDPNSSRAWRFAWDPIFWELCLATGGALSFDLDLYRDLDAASRRLYLFLKKVFWRRPVSPKLDLRHVAVDVLGFSPAIETWQIKRKLAKCIDELVGREILQLPGGVKKASDVFQKRSKATYSLQLHRGPHFDKSPTRVTATVFDSPLYDPLKTLGLCDAMISRLLKTHEPRLLSEWADIALAALERNGEKFFTTSPAAYFIDNIKAASAGKRTPPDWWRELRKRERRLEAKQEEAKATLLADRADDATFQMYLQNEAREAFEEAVCTLFADFTKAGRSEGEARASAEQHARLHLLNRYRHERNTTED